MALALHMPITEHEHINCIISNPKWYAISICLDMVQHLSQIFNYHKIRKAEKPHHHNNTIKFFFMLAANCIIAIRIEAACIP